jgi:hypothetical protein
VVILWLVVPVVITGVIALLWPRRGEFYEVEHRNRAIEKMSKWNRPQ